MNTSVYAILEIISHIIFSSMIAVVVATINIVGLSFLRTHFKFVDYLLNYQTKEFKADKIVKRSVIVITCVYVVWLNWDYFVKLWSLGRNISCLVIVTCNDNGARSSATDGIKLPSDLPPSRSNTVTASLPTPTITTATSLPSGSSPPKGVPDTIDPLPLAPDVRLSKPEYGPIPEDIIGIRTGIPCQDAINLIKQENENENRPLNISKTRYKIDVNGERVEVLADTVEARANNAKLALTCMTVDGKSLVTFIGRNLDFERDGRNLEDIEDQFAKKYGNLPQRTNVAAINPFNMVRLGRVYGPDGVLPRGSNACGDFQATGGWTILGLFGGVNLNPLQLSTCVGGLFILAYRTSVGRVKWVNVEVWDFRIASRAAEDVMKQRAEEIRVKSKSRLPL